ncbi:YciI family protein [Roseimarinus sediminis]|uniref:YciI family protein n=1 Tax=Roseimarinus sediminis TaxID=1610899 RepID=UPI003D1EBD74
MKPTLIIALMVLTRLSFGQTNQVDEHSASLEYTNHHDDYPNKTVFQETTSSELFALKANSGPAQLSNKMSIHNAGTSEEDSALANPNYDPALAEKLGGDAFGMKNYFFVILTTGSNTTSDNALISESFKGHLANINQLVKAGKLVVAGPLGKNANNYRGIFIFDHIHSKEEVENLLQSDPAIKNGLLAYEIFTWYGSAALPEYLPASDKIWKLKP